MTPNVTEADYGRSLEETAVIPPDLVQVLNEQYSQAVFSKEPAQYVYNLNGDIGETVLTPLVDESGECHYVLAVTRDVTERRRLENQLQHLAYHDSLTDLPHRRLFRSTLDEKLALAEQESHSVALMFIDCDRFKELNDTFGHDVGDEFVVIAPDQDEHHALQAAEQILEAARYPWCHSSGTLPVCASIGVTLYPFHRRDAETLMKCADRALYKAKSSGGNTCCLSSGY